MRIQVAEAVGVGHPDKIADSIADRILDIALDHNPRAQLSCEVLASKNLIAVAGEVGGENLDEHKVREGIREILLGLGYNLDDYQIILNFKDQSADIRSTSIEGNLGIVSGDQSLVVGYATNETSNYLPKASVVADRIIRGVEECVKSGRIKGIKYDCKAMVALSQDSVHQLYLSVQHDEDVDVTWLKDQLYELVVVDAMSGCNLHWDREFVLINHSSKFTIGGLDADTGSNNRKIMVDSYGNSAGHGGGGYSGKDLTKVDRLLAYYARWVCKNLVASGICDSIELEAIVHCGSAFADFYIKNIVSNKSEGEIMSCINNVFRFTILEIYKRFNRRDFWNYLDLAKYGHFTNEKVPWEKLDKVDDIRKHFYGH